jgi:spore maturation protein SpmA
MFSKTRIALSLAIVLASALSASAATIKPEHAKTHRTALFNMVTDFNGAGNAAVPFGIETFDRFGISSQR